MRQVTESRNGIHVRIGLAESVPEAAFLTNPATQIWLAPFLNNALSVSDAALRLRRDANQTLYRVRQMVKLGLLVVDRVEPRRGRSVKWYRSSAEEFFVPFTATPFEDLEAHRAAIDEPMQRRFHRNLARRMLESSNAQAWGTWIVNREGRMTSLTRQRQNLTFDAAQLGVLRSVWIELQLTPVQAGELVIELDALFHRYRRLNSPEASPFLLRLGLTPETDD
jgi:hypothetical protein